MTGEPTVAVFRPDDERLLEAISLLEALGVAPIADPMLAIEPTGTLPRDDAEYTILTSKTGADILNGTAWDTEGKLCAIGEPTADSLREAGFTVDVVPETYSSRGMVEHLQSEVEGSRIEVARSDHGSPILLDGLEAAGAYVHETILYRLVRPEKAGESTDAAAQHTLDGVLFSSSLTVEHFIEAAQERGQIEETRAGLANAVVGAIGEPTRETATEQGIEVDVVPDDADFESLARAVVAELETEGNIP